MKVAMQGQRLNMVWVNALNKIILQALTQMEISCQLILIGLPHLVSRLVGMITVRLLNLEKLLKIFWQLKMWLLLPINRVG